MDFSDLSQRKNVSCSNLFIIVQTTTISIDIDISIQTNLEKIGY